MKLIIAALALTASVSSFAQERKVLLNEKEVVTSDSVILVRTADTPKKVFVTFHVPMESSYCAVFFKTKTVSTTCSRTDPFTMTKRECDDGVCRDVTVTLTHTTRYKCDIQEPMPEDGCKRWDTAVVIKPHRVKIKFKNMPSLGGTEEQIFQVKARQIININCRTDCRFAPPTYDNDKVVFDVVPKDDRLQAIFRFGSIKIQPNKL